MEYIAAKQNPPRILVVTPEVTCLPKGMGNYSNQLSAKAGGLADVSAALIRALYEKGADIHVALPDYRSLFNNKQQNPIIININSIRKRMPEHRIHLAEDRIFFYLDKVYPENSDLQIKLAMCFQREVINNIIPLVQPDIIHCNDWMTGLIPGVARQFNIPCLFTIHNIHTVKTSLAHIEDIGVDAASFWKNLYYERMPVNYEETRHTNSVDFLLSGIFAAHFINTVSPTFLKELAAGHHQFVSPSFQMEINNKQQNHCAGGILNAPDPSFNPGRDKYLAQPYIPDNQYIGKKANKRYLQKKLNLIRDDLAPVLFWPSRLDLIQKGSQLFADILYDTVSRYWHQHLQIIFIANGEFQKYFKQIVKFHRFHDRVAVCDFSEEDARMAYGASDFILMPSRFEPCGLPQMIGPIYGSLPIAFDTGGIHDTIIPLDVDNNTGNGFLFNRYEGRNFLDAIDRAMAFYLLPQTIKHHQIRRIMKESLDAFNHDAVAQQYIALYENMLKRPLIVGQSAEKSDSEDFSRIMKVA